MFTLRISALKGNVLSNNIIKAQIRLIDNVKLIMSKNMIAYQWRRRKNKETNEEDFKNYCFTGTRQFPKHIIERG